MLAVVGMLAMFLVGGGILVHGVSWLHHAREAVQNALGAPLGRNLFNDVVGIAAGMILVGIVSLVGKVLPKRQTA